MKKTKSKKVLQDLSYKSERKVLDFFLGAFPVACVMQSTAEEHSRSWVYRVVFGRLVLVKYQSRYYDRED